MDLYALANPLPGAGAKVPLLEVVRDETTAVYLTESLVVTEYIAEQHGHDSLLPAKAEDRATMRLFHELCGSCFSYVPILRASGDEERNKAIQAFKEGLVNANTFLKHYQPEGPFLMGKQFTVAECITAPFVQRACTILPALTADDAVVVDPLDICAKIGRAHV